MKAQIQFYADQKQLKVSKTVNQRSDEEDGRLYWARQSQRESKCCQFAIKEVKLRAETATEGQEGTF